MPVQQIRDFLQGFGQSVTREKRSNPFWGPIIEKIPGLEKMLPELASPTREGPVTREAPALRQMTGLATKTKTSFEKELDRLGFSYQEIVHSTGNAEADNILKKYQGLFSTKFAQPLVQSEGYQKLSDAHKAFLMTKLLSGLRGAAKEAASSENPNLFAEVMINRIPKKERAAFEASGVDFEAIKNSLRKTKKQAVMGE
jgi:hypothetical protein